MGSGLDAVQLAVRAEPVEALARTQHFNKLSARGAHANRIGSRLAYFLAVTRGGKRQDLTLEFRTVSAPMLICPPSSCATKGAASLALGALPNRLVHSSATMSAWRVKPVACTAIEASAWYDVPLSSIDRPMPA